MRSARSTHAFALWLASLAIGIKVVLAAFVLMPPPADDLGFGQQVICTGGGFLVIDGEGDAEGQTVSFGHCPLCLAAALLLFAEEQPQLLAILFFAVALAFPLGLHRPKAARPPVLGFASRAPPQRRP